MKRKILAGTSIAVAGLTMLAACGGGSSSNSSNGSTAYSAGNTSIVNASNATGGVLNYALSSAGDSIDPGNTYYAFSWDFSRLYASPLLSYKPAPGNDGLTLEPSLATGLGVGTDGNKTWTYHIKSGLKFSDGTPITTADVKYAVERSNFAKDVLPNGPSYFAQYLADDTKYQGPYKDKSTAGLASIETPDPTTIVFHLGQPFAEFNYLVANPQTVVELGSETFPVTVRVLTGAERDDVYSKQSAVEPQFGEYQRKTTRVIPVLELQRAAG